MLSEQVGTQREWVTLQATAEDVVFEGVAVDGVTIDVDTLSIEINRDDDDSLVNYAIQPLTVTTGPTTTLTFNMDAADGELLRASGNLTLELYNFFQVSGGFAIEKSSRTVKVYKDDGDPLTIDDNTDVNVDLLTIGGNNVSAFAGLNGGTLQALGLSLTGVEFALALLSEKTGAHRQWVSLQATADDVSFVGIDGITVSVDTLSIEINRDDDDSLVNYAAQSLTVITGPSTDLTFNMDGEDGELLRASGNLTLELFNFFYVNGGFAIEKSSETVKVYKDDGNLLTTDDNTNVDVDLLTIGGYNVSAFAGMNGPASNADALGLSLTGVEFALALLSEKTGTQRQWLSLQGTADDVSFVGIDGITVSVDTLSIEVNHAAADGSLVNYAAMLPLFAVATGPGGTDLTFDLDAEDGEVLRASGNLTSTSSTSSG